MKQWQLAFAFAIGLSGCATWIDQFKHTPPEWEDPIPEAPLKDRVVIKNAPGDGPKRYKREDFVDSSSTEGSLWASDGQTNYFFTKNRVKSLGDLVSVTLDEAFVKELAIAFKKGLTVAERDYEIGLIQEERDRIRKEREARGEPSTLAAAGGLGGEAAAPPPREPAAIDKNNPQAAKADIPATIEDVDVLGKIEAKAGDKWLAEVIERFPNGNYRLKLSHKATFKNITRQIALVAVVRSGDIDDADSLTTGKLYEYQLRVYR